MLLTTALRKIQKMHGDETYATVDPDGAVGYSRRLDLELAIQARDLYDMCCVYGDHIPTPEKTYRLSEPLRLYDDSETVTYWIYRDCEPVYIVTVYTKLQYPDYDWKETFHETKYPKDTSKPWWLWKKPH